MIQVFDYLDYQEFLRDYYRERKKENFFFSYRFMGRYLKLDPGFLVKVLQGKNHISKRSISPICEFCKFSEQEASYFHSLVLFGKAKTKKESKELFEKLLSFRGMDTSTVEKNQYAFYQKWYHTAIRSLIGMHGFDGDYKKLSSMLSPSIGVKAAKESVNLLTNLGFVEQNGQGDFLLTKKSITTGEKWNSLAVRLFQEQTIELAKESLERHDKELRDISTMTIAIAPEDIDEIKELAREFRKSILQIKGSNIRASSVYQVNMQIFPLSEVTKGGNHE